MAWWDQQRRYAAQIARVRRFRNQSISAAGFHQPSSSAHRTSDDRDCISPNRFHRRDGDRPDRKPTSSLGVTVRASQTANGESSNGPQIGRHRLMICTLPFSSCIGLVRNQIADALRTRPLGVVDMHARDGLARTAVADVSRPLNALADGVVEDEYPVGTGRCLDQPLSLRVVDASRLRLRRRSPLTELFCRTRANPSRSSDTVSLIGRMS